jgi:catechol 2,3-dioxygenase-like lactoylglutathione lyase family enzyme
MLTQASPSGIMTRNLRFAFSGVFLFTASIGPLFAQLAGPNESGVSIAQAHLVVRNAAEQKKLWVDIMGAKVTHSGSLELLKLPGIFIVLEQGEPAGGSDGTSVNHLGFLTKDYAEMKAKITAAHIEVAADGYKADGCAAAPGTPACQFTVVFPDGVRVEFTEDKGVTVPATNHHIHMYTKDRESLRAWYAKTLGAEAGLRRGTIMAAKFPGQYGGELDFNPATEPPLATKGRSIDHIGFEVKGLAAFCKKLEAQGVTLDVPYHPVPGTGLKSAFITDPIGTRIELTEGLPAN